MVKIFLVRHGHSVGNERRQLTGHLDVALSALGHRQAELLADHIVAALPIDKIYSSDLVRAVDTIRPTAERLGLDIVREPALREMSVGRWEGVTYEEAATRDAELFRTWGQENVGALPVGGESWEQVLSRSLCFLDRVCRENDGKSIVATTHGGVIKALLYHFSEPSQNGVNGVDWSTNASITELYYKDGVYTVGRVGYDEYLGELKSGLEL